MFKIYWTDHEGQSHGQTCTELVQALQVTKEKRDAGHSFVTMASENPQHTGKQGVDSIVDGKTPDGQVYDWSKAGRAGKPRKTDRIITDKDR
ncbi:hypothetical protein [uncultured Rhodoferax sp.]|uniref:hypothetical protein n=1 Tax=uncultured Rhodoferax sp. TaxID=223188 RepID=UPI0025ECB161|nr:hypothetical protein [uncultured Rhodoferax sp.]